MPFHANILNFNAGELTPLLDARTDIAKYQSGCRTLENFIIVPYGGALRRPGTQYLGKAKYGNRQCRLIGFNFSVTTNFVLEFGHQYLRFWSNGVQVMNPSNPTNPLEITSPYTEAQLREFQYCQVNDLMFTVHPDVEPQQIKRIADDHWTMAGIVWDFPPTMDLNTEEITLTPADVNSDITITASTDVFDAGDVDSYWVIGHHRDDYSVDLALAAASGTSEVLDVMGNWEFNTYGNWSGTVRVQRRLRQADGSAGVTWETVRSYTSASVGERNVAATGREDKICELRISFTTDGDAGENDPNSRLTAGESEWYGFVKITDFFDDQTVDATVIGPNLWNTTATKLWSESSFSHKKGYPRTVCLHEQRLVFGGTRKQPLTVWGSVIDDFLNFRQGPNDDQSYSFTIAGNESNPINWMLSQGKLLIGTAGEEFTLSSQDETTAIGPKNVRADRQSSYGSAFIQAKLVNEVILFIQRQGRKIREMAFAWEKNGWVAPDLTQLAEHMASSMFVELAYAGQPDAILWCIRADGQLAGMTYERDQNVVGWHRHDTDGIFESVATIYGGTSHADQVWFSIKRTINGQPVRYIERLDPDFREAWKAGQKLLWRYMDSFVYGNLGTPQKVVTGIDHLEGKTVHILADGGVQPPRTVVGGQITLETAATDIVVGLPYGSLLSPMKIDIPMQNGTAQGRKGRIHTMTVRMHQSLGGEYSTDDGSTWNNFYFREPGDVMDESPPPFTGETDVAPVSPYQREVVVSLRQQDPLPLCILSIAPIVDFYGE